MFRFRLLFALIGVLSCLTMAGGMEWFFRRVNLAANLDDRASRVLIVRSEISQRVEQAGGQSGDVQITLTWNNRNDLDLSCIDPKGEKIWFQHKRSRSGGELDVDSNAIFGRLTSRPVENIRWPYGSAPMGTYRVYVDHYRNNGDVDPTPFKVSILEKGRLHEVRGSVAHVAADEPAIKVYEFNNTGEEYGWSGLLPAILRALLITGIWTSLLALLFTTAIWAGQTVFFRRVYKKRWLKPRAIWLLIGWGALSGLLAGVAGQLVFGLLAVVPSIPIQISRYVGWIVLGGLFGWLISLRMPNLPRWPALAGGVFGSWLGSIAFLISLQNSSGGWGRLEGAMLLGGMVGVMITLYLPYKEIIEPLQDLRISIAAQRLRPHRSRGVGTLKR